MATAQRNNFPVFAFPNSLQFYVGARQTHKQLLTLYNPYEFPIRFKILSTSPNKYTVIDPEGSVGPTCCVDLVVRHTQPNSMNCNLVDKFRLYMNDHTTRKCLGRRDIEARLLPGIPGEPDNNSNDGDSFQMVPQGEHSPEDKNSQYPIPNRSSNTSSQKNTMSEMGSMSQFYFALILGTFCTVGLVWPMQPEPSNVEDHFIPPYLHITHTVKMVFAFILGLVINLIFKPTNP